MLTVAQREVTAAERAAIARLGTSARSVGTRAMLVAPGGTMLAELTGADAAWPLAGTLDLAPGGRRPRGAEVAIGRAAADRLGLDRGDRLRIGRAEFRVSAIIEKLPRDAGFALAPPALVDEAGLALTGLVQPGSLTSTSYRVLLNGGRDPEAVGRAFQRQFPDGGWRASDRNDAGSGTRRFVDRLGQMLLLVALSALGDRRARHGQRGGGLRRLAPPEHCHLEVGRGAARDDQSDAADRAWAGRGAGDTRRAGGRRRRARAGRRASRDRCCRSRPTPARSGRRLARPPCSDCW